ALADDPVEAVAVLQLLRELRDDALLLRHLDVVRLDLAHADLEDLRELRELGEREARDVGERRVEVEPARVVGAADRVELLAIERIEERGRAGKTVPRVREVLPFDE